MRLQKAAKVGAGDHAREAAGHADAEACAPDLDRAAALLELQLGTRLWELTCGIDESPVVPSR